MTDLPGCFNEFLTQDASLQIDITGTEGVLRITNWRAFENKEDNHVEGMNGEQPSLTQLPVPSEYHSLAVSPLDASAQDVAHLYAAYAHDRENRTSEASNFRDAVRQHRLNDRIVQSSDIFFNRDNRGLDVPNPW